MEDEIILIGKNWTIVKDVNDAALVKIVHPDGGITWGVPVTAGVRTQHLGPGNHPSGSPQSVHAGRKEIIEKLEARIKDVSLTREDRVTASRYRDTLLAAMRTTYQDKQLIADYLDDLIAGGANRLLIHGPNAYLVSEDNALRYRLRTKLEREYAEFRLSGDAVFGNAMQLQHMGPGDHPSGTSQDVHAGDDVGNDDDGSDVNRVANRVIAKAKVSEPQVTKNVDAAVKKSGGELKGLHNRLKTSESLSRKIKSTMDETGQPIEEVLKDMTDSLRYTAVFESDKFTESVISVEDELQLDGYSLYDTKYRNYYGPDSVYEGYNTVWVNEETDELFELQFHTPESLRIKDVNHDIYKKMRVESDPIKRLEYVQEMKNNWTVSDYVRPPGYEKLGVPVEK